LSPKELAALAKQQELDAQKANAVQTPPAETQPTAPQAAEAQPVETVAFKEKTPEELAKMGIAERMSYDHQKQLHQQNQKKASASTATPSQDISTISMNPAAKSSGKTLEQGKSITDVMSADAAPKTSAQTPPSDKGEQTDYAKLVSDGVKADKAGFGKPAATAAPAVPQEVKKTPEQLIEDAYKEPLKGLNEYIKEFEAKKNELKEQDEVARRRSGSMRMIAGISDGLSALANLVGVAGVNGVHASNQTLQGASAPLAQRLEAARLERKSDLKDVSDRLDAYKAQRDNLNLQKGTSLAELEVKREEAKAAAEAAGVKNQIDWMKFLLGEDNENKRHAATLVSNAQEGEADRASSERIAAIRAQASGKEPWKFSVDGQEYIGQADETTVAKVFNLLPEDVRAQYGKWTGDQFTGKRQQPTKEEMMIAIGMNLENEDFKKAMGEKYKSRISNGGKTSDNAAQDELDNIQQSDI
jgi:hypothetical protein